ncbi:MAG TPA: hypothetical protein VFN26_09390 [Candidatus Acidoferrum sp.]|nr:hypothetical protein [Candidatus Acidoferrum sp.]
MLRFRMSSSLSIPKPDAVRHVARKSAVIALCTLVTVCLAVPLPALNANPPESIAPVPIPGGDVVPPLGLIHLFFPGPTSIGNDGFDIEPSTITNFRGFTGVAMLAGTATDGNGKSFNLMSDIRVFQGEYVSADGKHHHGTFVFI